MPVSRPDLLQNVAERIIAASMVVGGATRAEVVSADAASHASGVDIVVINGHEARRVKVKADPYFGVDGRKISDRALSFYRADTASFAFEVVANSLTREPGWTLSSDAQDLYYYYLALSQSPEDIAALMSERDEVFFSELTVERDELVVLPMQSVRAWFELHNAEYVPRPVILDGFAAWYRLVPRADGVAAIQGVTCVGSLFEAVGRPGATVRPLS